jgi:hypothetical protein
MFYTLVCLSVHIVFLPVKVRMTSRRGTAHPTKFVLTKHLKLTKHISLSLFSLSRSYHTKVDKLAASLTTLLNINTTYTTIHHSLITILCTEENSSDDRVLLLPR